KDPPFSTFAPTKGSDALKVSTAYLKLLEMANQIQPTSYAYYAIAGSYYTPAISTIATASDRDRLQGTTTEAAAHVIEQYVEKGDAIQDDAASLPSANVAKYLY